MRAIMATATPQAVIILFGSFVITAIGLNKLGGWGELVSMCKANSANFALWRPLNHPDFPWLGVLIASPIIGIWYWCTDQYIVQRALSARDLATARRGALFGGVLKVWPVLIFLIPGLIGWALHTKGIITIPPKMVDGVPEMVDGVAQIDGDRVFPTLVTALLPVGIRGLIVACLLSALMSSLASLFNSSAALFTVDVYEKLNPGQSEKHLLVVGRIATTVVVGLGIIWIPVMAKIAGGGLYQYLQSVQGYLAPPITAVFLLGLFWKRMNSAGATWALGVGFVLGMFKLTVQALFGADPDKIHDPAFLAAIGDFNFLYTTGILLLISVIVMIVASLMTPEPAEEKTRGLTYASIHHLAEDEIKSSWDLGNKVMAGLILVMVAAMYLYFSFWLM